jgi:pantoate--beta-alanine ligase
MFEAVEQAFNTDGMQILTTIAELRAALRPLRQAHSIGFVPTMGALHAGHAALFRAARESCGVVIASIFVNPSQFNDPRDLAAYPRALDADQAAAGAAGVDILFCPPAEEMYPDGFATWVDVGGAAEGLEGAHRPGHFHGVATIVLKLLMTVQPDAVFFGQKDAQQVAVVSQLVRDLNVDVELRVVPTVRDSDGVALSSRNARLSPQDRERAAAIPRALRAGVSAFRAREDAAAAARAALGGLDVDYVEVVTWLNRPTLALAVRIGGTRLIDNAPLDGEHA